MYSKRKICLCLMTLLVLCSCSTQVGEDCKELPKENINHLSFTEEHTMEDALRDSVNVPTYSEDCYFVPLQMNDSGQIAGKTYFHTKESDKQAYEKSLTVLDTSNMQYTDIVYLDDEKNKELMNRPSDKDAFIVAISNDYVLYAVHDINKDDTRLKTAYYLFDLKEHKETMIHEEEMEFSQVGTPYGILTKDHVYMTGLSAMENGIYEYDISNKKAEKIINALVAPSMVVHEGNLYYLSAEPENTLSFLNVYSLQTKKNTEIIKEDHSISNIMLAQVLSDGKELFIICNRSENNSILYHMNVTTKEVIPVFETPYMSSATFVNGYLTWASSPTIAGRLTLQYYVYDVEHAIDYFFKDAYLIGSKAGICWLQYLVPESEIIKGQLYNPKNTVLLYKSNT